MTKESHMTTEVYASWESIQKEKFTAMKVRSPAIFDKIKKGLTLDIGCGNGFFEKYFGGNFIGIDMDEKMLRGSVCLFPAVLGDGSRMPFTDYSFDTIVSIDTMHLIKDSDFLRILKPGGLVILAIFFNDNNYTERRKMLTDKLKDMVILEEFTIGSKEKEYVVIAEKPAF